MTARPVAALATAAILAAALSSCSSGPPPVTSHGTLTIYVDPLGGSSVQDSYPDITDGSQVTVTDSSGKVIGTGTLSYDQRQSAATAAVEAAIMGPGMTAAELAPDVAVYTWTVTGLPGGLPRYGIKIGNRSVHWEGASAVKKPQLTLGNP